MGKEQNKGVEHELIKSALYGLDPLDALAQLKVFEQIQNQDAREIYSEYLLKAVEINRVERQRK